VKHGGLGPVKSHSVSLVISVHDVLVPVQSPDQWSNRQPLGSPGAAVSVTSQIVLL
jgi:hypothetical protein